MQTRERERELEQKLTQNSTNRMASVLEACSNPSLYKCGTDAQLIELVNKQLGEMFAFPNDVIAIHRLVIVDRARGTLWTLPTAGSQHRKVEIKFDAEMKSRGTLANIALDSSGDLPPYFIQNELPKDPAFDLEQDLAGTYDFDISRTSAMYAMVPDCGLGANEASGHALAVVQLAVSPLGAPKNRGRGVGVGVDRSTGAAAAVSSPHSFVKGDAEVVSAYAIALGAALGLIRGRRRMRECVSDVHKMHSALEDARGRAEAQSMAYTRLVATNTRVLELSRPYCSKRMLSRKSSARMALASLALDQISALTGVVDANVYLYNRKARELWSASAAKKGTNPNVPVGVGILGHCISASKAITEAKPSDNARYVKSVDGEPLDGTVVTYIPMSTSGGESLGAVRARIRVTSDAEVNERLLSLKTLASVLSVSLLSSACCAELVEEAERKEAELGRRLEQSTELVKDKELLLEKEVRRFHNNKDDRVSFS